MSGNTQWTLQTVARRKGKQTEKQGVRGLLCTMLELCFLNFCREVAEIKHSWLPWVLVTP